MRPEPHERTVLRPHGSAGHSQGGAALLVVGEHRRKLLTKVKAVRAGLGAEQRR